MPVERGQEKPYFVELWLAKPHQTFRIQVRGTLFYEYMADSEFRNASTGQLIRLLQVNLNCYLSCDLTDMHSSFLRMEPVGQCGIFPANESWKTVATWQQSICSTAWRPKRFSVKKIKKQEIISHIKCGKYIKEPINCEIMKEIIKDNLIMVFLNSYFHIPDFRINLIFYSILYFKIPFSKAFHFIS